jgi:hypothetical protein
MNGFNRPNGILRHCARLSQALGERVGLGDSRLKRSAPEIAYCRPCEQGNDYQDYRNLPLHGLWSHTQTV